MLDPKISIMIPTYNQEDYIKECIESVLKLEYSNLQIVLSDDCSTDKTYEIAKEYESDPRFKAYKCEKNIGRVRNYHHLLNDLVDGEWVLNCDGDDYLLESDFYKKSINLIKNNPEIVIFTANRYKLKNFTSKLYIQKTEGKEGIIDGTEYLRDYYTFGNGFFHITSLYHRETAIHAGFYTSDIISSDVESLLKIIINKKIYHHDSIVAVWRDHDDNVSKSIDAEKRASNLQMIQSVYQYHREKDSLPIEELDIWRKCFYKYRIISIGNRFLTDLNYPLFFKFINSVKKQGDGLILPALLSPSLFLTFICPIRIKVKNLIKRAIKGDQSTKVNR